MTAQKTRSYGFRVTGQVQGVAFRASARREARQLGVCGWVANCADGSVVGEVGGDAAGLAQFRRWLGHGPPGARVDALEWAEVGNAAPLAAGFRIAPDQA